MVKITNSASRKSVYCEALQIDENFLAHYNQSPRRNISDRACAVVMNEWYRSRLGCSDTQTEYPLEIKRANHLCGKFCACIQHPQIVVRLATWLALLGLALGVIGVLLGIAALCPQT